MMVTNLSTVFSVYSHMKTEHPDLFAWLKIHRKALKHFFKGVSPNSPAPKIQSAWNLIVVLDCLMTFCSPHDVPQDSLAYPLFNRGTQLMQLQLFAAHRASDPRKALGYTLSTVGIAVRLTARIMYACQRLFTGPASIPRTVTPLALTEELATTSSAHRAALSELTTHQQTQLTLSIEAQAASEEQGAVISRLSELSCDKQALVLATVQRIKKLMGNPETQKTFRTLVLQQAELQNSRSLVAQLQEKLKHLGELTHEELSHMEKLKDKLQGILNGRH